MFKQFFVKKMLQAQLKNLPADMRERVSAAIEKDPELFTQIAKEIQEEIKKGRNQMMAATEVMSRHKSKLQELMK